jgi:ABC-type sugar transport system ATPase subunit
MSLLVVSHNLEHVFSIADRIAVMRGGRLVGVRSREETSPKEIVELITGAAAIAPAGNGAG